jgi:hypothetical protein
MKIRNFVVWMATVLCACMVQLAVASTSDYYMVTKEESHKNIERDIEVTLVKRVDEQTLKDISKEIKDTETKNYEKTFIGYRLATGGDSFFWATASYEPELTIRIIGESVEAHDKLMSKKVSAEGRVLGKWMANNGIETKMIAYSKKGKTFIKTIYSDGVEEIEECTVSKVNGKKKLQDESGIDHGEYYMINGKGDLEFWSESGNFYTAKKIKEK